MAEQHTPSAGERQSLSDRSENARIDKAALIIQAIGQAAEHADGDCGNVQASSNWLALIGAAASEAHRLITGFPLHYEQGAVCPQVAPLCGELEGEVGHG